MSWCYKAENDDQIFNLLYQNEIYQKSYDSFNNFKKTKNFKGFYNMILSPNLPEYREITEDC